MLKNQTLDMVLFTIDVRNRLCYHMVQALQRAEAEQALQKRLN